MNMPEGKSASSLLEFIIIKKYLQNLISAISTPCFSSFCLPPRSASCFLCAVKCKPRIRFAVVRALQIRNQRCQNRLRVSVCVRVRAWTAAKFQLHMCMHACVHIQRPAYSPFPSALTSGASRSKAAQCPVISPGQKVGKPSSSVRLAVWGSFTYSSTPGRTIELLLDQILPSIPQRWKLGD